MALVLVLILGVNAVFRLTSDTVNVGMALSTADRDNRAAQPVLYNDMQTAVVTGAPFFVIRSDRLAAFRTSRDETGDRDVASAGNDPARRDRAIRTIDLDGNNVEGEANVPGEVISPVTFNARNHRTDELFFFSNHLFRRQTGSGNQLIDAGTASTEAYVWYGHLNGAVSRGPMPPPPPPGGGPPPPIGATNRSNFAGGYTTDWDLGRVAMLLQESPTGPTTPGHPFRGYIQSGGLAPLVAGSQSPDRYALEWFRYDVAQASIAGYRQILASSLLANPVYLTPTVDWADTSWYRAVCEVRFEGTRRPDRPLTAAGAARTVPVFLPACSQFIVEYAGDYLKQDAFGRVTGTYLDGPSGTDGETDFVVLNPTAPVAEQVRRTRWYGFPRNVDTSDDASGAASVKTRPARGIIDVVPLRDVLLAADVAPERMLPDTFFEHFISLPTKSDYGAPGALAYDARYCAAWAPSDLARGSLTRPKMVRITLVADDPQGRMTEGQACEYVMDLP